MPLSQASLTINQHLELWASGATVPLMLARLCQVWNLIGTGVVKIRDVHGEVVSLVPNEAQRRVYAKMLEQAAAGKPIRINVGKARKVGISTLVQAIFCCFGFLFDNQVAITLAHEAKATQEIFEIAQLVARNLLNEEPTSDIKFPGNSRYTCQTAGAQAVGAGGTPSALHISELAKWKQNKDSTEYNSVNSVPDVPETIIVYETTFVGRELAYQRFDEAHAPEHPYEPVFIAWFVDERLTAEVPDGFTWTDEENLIAAFAATEGTIVTDAQLAWRRNKIRVIGPERFKQEFPSTPEEAVAAFKGLIFPYMRRALVDTCPYNTMAMPWECRVGGIDFGYHHPAVIWSGIRVDGVVWLLRFWRQFNAMPEDYVPGLVQGTTYWCDPAETESRLRLASAARKADLQCTFAPSPIVNDPKEGTRSKSEMLRVLDALHGGRLKIHRQVSPQLLIETDNLCWDEKTGKPAIDIGPGEAAHYDSLKALVYTVLGALRRDAMVATEQVERGMKRRDRMLHGW